MKTIIHNLLSVIALTLFFVGCHAQSTEYDVFTLKEFYTEPWLGETQSPAVEQKLTFYIHLKKGEYQLKLSMRPNQDDAEYKMNIAFNGMKDNDFTPVDKECIVNKSTAGVFTLDIHIAREAFYRVEIGGKPTKGTGGLSFTSPITIETPKGGGGEAYSAKWQTSPSVHLRYQTDDEKKYDYDWLYGEIQVPEGYDPAYTFYMCIGFYRGYFGIQVNSLTERRVLFSVWDSSDEAVDRDKVNPEDRVALLNKHPDVSAGSFGNEGTGGQSYRKYPWATGVPVKFLMNMRPLSGDFAVYSAWFMDNEADGWKYMASWQAPREKRYFDGFYSFVENFGRGTGQMQRKADFYNMWGRRADNGQWMEFNKAKLTHTDGDPDSRSDYEGGISPTAPTRFYMSSGGYTQAVDPGKTIVAKKTEKAPAVDLPERTAEVDTAIARKIYLENSGIVPDKKIPVKRAEASEEQPGEGINRSFDDKMNTLYHSRWRGTQFPVTLTYYFENEEQIDYFYYIPRTEGSNGNFKKIEVWTSDEAHPAFIKLGDYDFEGKSAPSKITFPGGLKSPKAVRIVVNSGEGDDGKGFASCAEMSFNAACQQPSIPDVFTDETCSALRPDINRQTIDAIPNRFFRNIAVSLFEKNYPAEFRIQEYKPYPHPHKVAKANKTSTYSLLDNPTGIFVNEGEELVVFVGKTGGENISLGLIDFEKGFSVINIFLDEGANSFKSIGKGLLYVMYHTSNPKAQPVKIHIASGTVNGYYDISKHSPSDWRRLLDKAVDKHFDVVGKYAHLTFPTASFKTYTPDGNRLIQVYDSIAWLEQRFIGLEKYKNMNKNRMYSHVFYSNDRMSSYAFGYATSNRIAFTVNGMNELCNPDKLRSTAIWGPAHEVGHVNQTRPGFRWAGMVEVSNNVYSMYVQRAFGNKARLDDERDGNYNNRYEKGFTEIIARKAVHADYPDVFCKLIPFWQLELYYSVVKNRSDFYADVHEQIRRRPDPTDDGTAQLEFIRICCDVAREDLTDFFKAWGLLTAFDSEVKGYYDYYPTEHFKCTQQQIDEIVRYAKKYPKPTHNLQYIHEGCLEAFKQNKKIEKGAVERTGYVITAWKNVAAFEVYDGEKPVFISPKSDFSMPENITKPVIYAVPAKGEKIRIYEE
jgi:hypothetical protein